jgi:hypothetical protein
MQLAGTKNIEEIKHTCASWIKNLDSMGKY